MNKAETVSPASWWSGGGVGGLLPPILQKTGLDWYLTLNSVISVNSVNTNITGDYILNIKWMYLHNAKLPCALFNIFPGTGTFWPLKELILGRTEPLLCTQSQPGAHWLDTGKNIHLWFIIYEQDCWQDCIKFNASHFHPAHQFSQLSADSVYTNSHPSFFSIVAKFQIVKSF